MRVDRTSAEFFEAKYRERADPWNFAGSEYEKARYGAMAEALGGRRYGRAFEPGCSIGVFTVELARRCERLEATDISETAVEQARRRCRDWPNVRVSCGALPQAIPDGWFDLMVLSEIGYYFSEAGWGALASELVGRVPPGGNVLATHWLGHSEDHLLAGERVHEVLRGIAGLKRERLQGTEGYLLERWVRA